MQSSLKKKLSIMAFSTGIFFVFFILIIFYISSNRILNKTIEENLINSMNTLFIMLEAHYKSIEKYFDLNNEKNIIKKMMLEKVDHLYSYANNIYQRVLKHEITMEKAKDIVWQYFSKIKITKSGYVYILREDGTILRHPKAGLVDKNLNIPGKGYDFIRWQMKKLNGCIEYAWQNPDEIIARDKVVAQRYFAPFQWIISLSEYQYDFTDVIDVRNVLASKKNFIEAINNLKFGKEGYAFALNSEFVLVIHPRGAEGKSLRGTNLESIFNQPGNIEKAQKETVFVTYIWDNPGETKMRDKVAAFRYFKPYDWLLCFTAYPEDFTSEITGKMYFLISFIIITLLLFFSVLLFFIFKNIVSPVSLLVDEIKTITNHMELNRRIVIKGNDEISELGKNFNLMIQQIESHQDKLEEQVADRTIELENAKEFSKNILDNSPEAIHVINKEGKLIYANPASKILAGSTKKIIGMDWINHPYVKKVGFDENFHEALKDKTIYRENVPFLSYTTHSEQILNVTFIPMPNEKGFIDNVLIMWVDNTEKFRAEKKLIEERAFSKGLLENSPYAIQVLDKNGNIIYINPACKLISGYQEEYLLGQNILQLESMRKLGFIDETLDNVRNGKTPFLENVLFKSPQTGREMILNITFAPIYNTEGKVENIFMMYYDNTARAIAEKKVRMVLKKLEEKDRIISEDIGMAKRIQNNLLPKDYQSIKEADFFVHYQPQMEVGGDIYDIYAHTNGMIRIFIADATGHGVQAALTTMLIKSEYEKIKIYDISVSELLMMLNGAFYQQYYHLSVFFTCFVLDINLKNKKIFYTSAGHPEQYLITKKSVKKMKSGGKMMGVKNKVHYELDTLDLEAGDKIFLFTDGLFEEFNDREEEFTEEKLLQIIKKYKNNNIKDLGDRICQDLKNFIGKKDYNDDITVIGVEIK